MSLSRADDVSAIVKECLLSEPEALAQPILAKTGKVVVGSSVRVFST